jgi:hypothetical protein
MCEDLHLARETTPEELDAPIVESDRDNPLGGPSRHFALGVKVRRNLIQSGMIRGDGLADIEKYGTVMSLKLPVKLPEATTVIVVSLLLSLLIAIEFMINTKIVYDVPPASTS